MEETYRGDRGVPETVPFGVEHLEVMPSVIMPHPRHHAIRHASGSVPRNWTVRFECDRISLIHNLQRIPPLC